jgi:PAS domain S-box-containing protein
MISHTGRSILIVEDEQIVAKDIQQTLDELGYDAFAIASSAEDAIDRASARCPDLVLMDIRIKGKRDGIETARILKTRFGIPVVYLTAHADDATIERAKTTEPHGYLVKPVKSAELHSVVEVSLYKHEMEKRLRERERWFSTTLRSIADAVITVDLAGIVTFMNPAAEALTGCLAGNAIGKPARDILRLMKDNVAEADETPLATALRENRAVDLQELSLLNIATGALRLINDSAAPVIDRGETIGAVMVFRDVTEQKNLRKQLELADRLASLGTMSAGVAHEVNNPLAVIMANAAYIAEELARYRAELGDAPPPVAGRRLGEIAQALSDVQSAANRIACIVSDLRAFSRPAQPSATLIDVASCLDWAIRTTSHELRHRAKVVTRLSEVPAVRGDEARLAQVFINLLVNAAHAINPGNAEQNEVAIATSTDESGWGVVEITDTGEGIPKENLPRIFEPFFTTKAGGEGTGLGLSICHGIVTSLGGRLLVESQVGKGTKFLVLLPPTPREPGETKTTVSLPPTSVLRGRILVVDDEPEVLHTIKRILQDQELVCTNSVQEALALIARGERFDLVLSDVMMPAMTGVQFYEALLDQNPTLARRMVFLSGGALTATIDDFLRSVPNRQIEKPFEVASLRETIQKVLRGPEAGS